MNKLESLPKAKAEMQPFIDGIVNEIINGDVDPLKAEIQLKIMQEAIDKIRENPQVRQSVMEEASKYTGQTFMGAEIKLSTRNTADYSLDQEWTTLKAKLKAREALLKSSKGIDPETGEEVVIYKSSEVLSIKL